MRFGLAGVALAAMVGCAAWGGGAEAGYVIDALGTYVTYQGNQLNFDLNASVFIDRSGNEVADGSISLSNGEFIEFNGAKINASYSRTSQNTNSDIGVNKYSFSILYFKNYTDVYYGYEYDYFDAQIDFIVDGYDSLFFTANYPELYYPSIHSNQINFERTIERTFFNGTINNISSIEFLPIPLPGSLPMLSSSLLLLITPKRIYRFILGLLAANQR